MENNVDHPSHYNTDNPIILIKEQCEVCTRRALECIDVIRNMPTWKGNAIKYLWRAGLKKESSMSSLEKEIEDLNKAIWYIKDRINFLTDESKST